LVHSCYILERVISVRTMWRGNQYLRTLGTIHKSLKNRNLRFRRLKSAHGAGTRRAIVAACILGLLVVIPLTRSAFSASGNGSFYSSTDFARIRALDGGEWSPTTETPAAVLSMIQDMRPQVLERYVSGGVNASALLPGGLSEQQFLQASEDYGATIVPRISLQDPNLYSEAQSLYNLPINPPMRYLSLDNWAPYSQGATQAQVVAMFQKLYAQGWEGIGVNMCGGYYPTYGYATWADFCVLPQQNYNPDLKTLNQLRSAEPNLQLFLLYIDFPGQMKQFVTLSGNQQAQVLTTDAQQQASNGYKLVYNVLQTFYDSNNIFTSSGQSIRSVIKGLMTQYNSWGSVSTTTTSATVTSTTPLVMTTVSTSSFASSLVTSSLTSSIATTTSPTFASSSQTTQQSSSENSSTTTFLLSYPILAIALVVSLTTGAFVFIRLRRNRN
jgi:hypothetical protein